MSSTSSARPATSFSTQALSTYAQWTKTVPDMLTSAVRLVHYPPAPVIPEPLRGASAIVIMACCTGSTADGEALVKPLRSIGARLRLSGGRRASRAGGFDRSQELEYRAPAPKENLTLECQDADRLA
jgi:hypothetical protein